MTDAMPHSGLSQRPWVGVPGLPGILICCVSTLTAVCVRVCVNGCTLPAITMVSSRSLRDDGGGGGDDDDGVLIACCLLRTSYSSVSSQSSVDIQYHHHGHPHVHHHCHRRNHNIFSWNAQGETLLASLGCNDNHAISTDHDSALRR